MPSAGVDSSQLTRVCKQAPRRHCSSLIMFLLPAQLHTQPLPRLEERLLRGNQTARRSARRQGWPICTAAPATEVRGWLPALSLLGPGSHVSSNLHHPGLLPDGSDGKRICLQGRRREFEPWVRKIPWRRKWPPAPVCLPGEAHGQRGQVGFIQSMGLQRVRHD